MDNDKQSKSTGPRTAKGKAKSSLNAVSHGLTSTRVMPDEVQMMEDFTAELVQHYQPQSPLEVLQIQRIAFCRAKLAKLMDIEIAGREISRRQIQTRPDLVMAKLTQYPEPVRALALRAMGGESVLAALGLEEATFFGIVQEIQAFAGVVRSERDLPMCYPRLCAYLTSAPPAPELPESAGLDQRLMVLAKRIRQLTSASERETPDDPDSALGAMLRQSQREQQATALLERKLLCDRSDGRTLYRLAVAEDLHSVLQLARDLAQLPAVMDSFEDMKAWLLRSTDLPADEAERMMKYQTSLERRLSSAIGELLELRKLRIN